MTKIIGLTGPTGAGKSTAAKEFARLGANCIDADQVARKVVEEPECLRELQRAFGEEIVADGKLNRPGLAAKAFASPEKTEQLNAITHPRIKEEIFRQIEAYVQAGAKMVLIDGAVLLESGMGSRLDAVVAVLADPETRLQRILRRDGISPEQALQRMSIQKDQAYYRRISDYQIDGSASPEEQRQQIRKIYQTILEAS